jgi:hypothetical protein
VHSWWNVGIFSGYDQEGLVLGYLGNNLSLGQLLISRTGSNQISFSAESVYAPQIILKPGQTLSSDRLMKDFKDGTATGKAMSVFLTG